MRVIKFGESALRDVHSIGRALAVVEAAFEKEKQLAVVVSAMQNVFSRLYEISQLAMVGDNSYKPILEKIQEEHFALVKHFIDIKTQAKAIANLKVILNDLEEILYGVYLLWELSPRTLDHIRTFGVRLMAQVFTECLRQRGIDAMCYETQRIIITSDHFGNARPDMKITLANIQQTLIGETYCNVYTGYLGGTPKGESTTLGKSGSSLTASLIAVAGNADSLEVYADKSGLTVSDTNYLENATVLTELSYGEAMEIAHFGNTIVYPPAFYPAFKAQIPVILKNIDIIDFQGTKIHAHPQVNQPIRAFSCIPNISLVTIQGAGMLGVAGMAARVFSALADAKINVIMITQASSEHSITLAVNPEDASMAKKFLENTFQYEIEQENIDGVLVEDGLAVLAIIGENMRNTPGIAGRIFSALGKHQINVVAIAQGSSELNISVVLSAQDLKNALRVLFEEFMQNKKHNP